MKRVLSVGQCSADHWSIRHLLEGNFQAEVVAAHSAADALAQLRAGKFDLVLVNRVLDADGSAGLPIIQAIKADETLADVPVMLVTNFREHQEQAVAAGAEPGFGKAELNSAEVRESLRGYLGS
jgi:two-component system chemotaxis response regulator CheY